MLAIMRFGATVVALASTVGASPPIASETCPRKAAGASMLIQTRSTVSTAQDVVDFDDLPAAEIAQELELQQVHQTSGHRQGKEYTCPQTCGWCKPAGASSEVAIESDVKYGEAVNPASGKSEALLMDTYSLPDSASDGARPVVLVIHGGAFRESSTKLSTLAVRAAKTFARHGYWVASIEYRRNFEYCLSHQMECWWSSQSKPPLYAHPVHDALAAVRYVHRQAAQLGVDPQKIALFGCSAGGITIADALTRDYGQGDSGNAGFPSEVAAGISLSGAMSGGSVSSQKAAGKPIAPYLAFHNNPDPILSYNLALKTKDFLDGRGSTNTLVTIPGSGHCPNVLSGDYLQQILGFLQEHLRLSGPTCAREAAGEAQPPASQEVPAPGQQSPAPEPEQRVASTPAPAPTAAPTKMPTLPATTSPTDLTSNFMPVDGGDNRACRGSDQHDIAQHYYQVHSDISSLQECKATCVNLSACTGVEYVGWGNYKRCKVWTIPIRASIKFWGAKCFRHMQ